MQYLVDIKEKPIGNVENLVTIVDTITIRGRSYNPQKIELTVTQSHPALRPGANVAFSVEINYQERLVIVQEVKRNYLRNLDIDEVIKTMRSAIDKKYDLSIYTIVLLKTGCIPKTSCGKVERHACLNNFLNAELEAIHTWTINPLQDLLQLQTDIDILFKKIQLCSEQGNCQAA